MACFFNNNSFRFESFIHGSVNIRRKSTRKSNSFSHSRISFGISIAHQIDASIFSSVVWPFDNHLGRKNMWKLSLVYRMFCTLGQNQEKMSLCRPHKKTNHMKLKSSPLQLYTNLTQLKALTPSGIFTVCLEGIVTHWGKIITRNIPQKKNLHCVYGPCED